MDEVFGDEGGFSAADQERLVAINRRIGLDRYAYAGSQDDAKSSNGDHEKIDV